MTRLTRSTARVLRGAQVAVSGGAQGMIGVLLVTGGVLALAGLGWAAITLGAFFILAAAVR